MKLEELRRRAVEAQGYLQRARGDADDVEATIRRLSCVQLDSVVVVERSHRLALAARVGRVPRGVETELLRAGRAFEYWAHEACLLPIEDYPLFKRRMRERRAEHHWWGPVISGDPKLARRVLARVRAKGNVRAQDFDGRSAGFWELKPEKRMLDALWTAGKLAVSGRDTGFVRRYDLPARVIPQAHLRARAPGSTQFTRALISRAVRARGALTTRGIVDHYRHLNARELQPHVDAMARRGELQRVEPEDGGAPVFLPPAGEEPKGKLPRGVLLSPFDNLLWDRAWARRIFDFSHIIELYKRQPERRFGYYVMPVLAGDRVIARADLKNDRDAGVLRVRALHKEERWSSADEDAWRYAYERLARCLGSALEDG